MQKIIILLIFLACLGGCTSDELKTSEVKHQSKLEIQYQSIGKVGCDPSSVSDEETFTDYLDYASAGESLLAQNSLLKMHRHFRCMSAYDFANHYNNIMSEIETNFSNEDAYIYASPLVFLLMEHGGRVIDSRAQDWMATALPYMSKSFREGFGVANGIGVNYIRGLSLVQMSVEEFELLYKSSLSISWGRAQCPYNQSVFIVDESDESTHILCLNDSCPLTNEIFTEEELAQDGFLEQACADARESFENAKTGGGVPSSNDDSNGNGLSGSGHVFDDLIDCANEYNSSTDEFVCLTQVAIGDNSFEKVSGNFNNIKVGVEAEVGSKQCSPNPISGDNPPDEGTTPEAWEEAKQDREKIEEQKEIVKYWRERWSTIFRARKTADRTTEGSYENMEAKRTLRNLTRSDEKPGQEEDTWSDEEERAFENWIAASNKLAEMKGSYKATHGYDYKNIKDLFDGWTNTCDSSVTGCSQKCSITDQMASDSNRCLGLNSVDNQLTQNVGNDGPTGDPPGGDPTVMVRRPEQIVPTGAFASLTQCMAEAMGTNTPANPSGSGESCGALILCTNSSMATVDSLDNCSCGESGGFAYEEEYGWGRVSECNALISCERSMTECGCGFGRSAEVLQGGGGIPVDPSIMLRVVPDETLSPFGN